jgi:hypothetical protein
MFPKMGRRIPAAAAARDPVDYASAIAEALRADLGNSHRAIKTLMRWTAANERTVKNWLSGVNGPSGEHLLEIIRNSDLAFQCVLRLADRRLSLSNRKLEELRDVLQNTTQLLSEMTQPQEYPRSRQNIG